MIEQLFSDQDAAATIEELSPNLAIVIRAMVKRGQCPEHIYRWCHLKHTSPLIKSLIRQAAHHYQAAIVQLEGEPQ